MSNYSISFLMAVLLLGACNKDTSNCSQQIIGDWAYIDDNGKYAELYIENGYIKTYHEQYDDFFGRMKYSIEKDSLFFNQMRYQINFQEDKSIILRNDDFSLCLFSIYPLKTDSINSINPFYLRRCNFLVNRGIISMKEAIDYLNRHVPNPDEWQPEEESIL